MIQISSGSPPLTVTFSADTKGLPVQLVAWSIDGNFLGTSAELTHTFNKTGTHRVELQAGGASSQKHVVSVTIMDQEFLYLGCVKKA